MFHRFGLETRRDVGSRLTLVHAVPLHVFASDFGVDRHTRRSFQSSVGKIAILTLTQRHGKLESLLVALEREFLQRRSAAAANGQPQQPRRLVVRLAQGII